MNKSKANKEDMYNDLLNLGRIFNVENKANELINKYRMEIQELTQNINTDDPLRVFVYDSGGYSIYCRVLCNADSSY